MFFSFCDEVEETVKEAAMFHGKILGAGQGLCSEAANPKSYLLLWNSFGVVPYAFRNFRWA